MLDRLLTGILYGLFALVWLQRRLRLKVRLKNLLKPAVDRWEGVGRLARQSKVDQKADYARKDTGRKEP